VSIRLFVAVDLPEDVRDDLALMAHGLPGARWLDDTQLHLTLRFVGEVDGVVYRDVMGVLGRIRAQPFEIALAGLGFFPPRGQPRSLWAGVTRSEPLEHLRKVVDGGLSRLGLPTDRKRWVPHVTLARLDGTPASRLGRFITDHSLYRSRPFMVEGVSLYSSQLQPKGALYELEASFPL